MHAASTYVSSRRIGEATVTVINDGEFDYMPLVPWLNAPEDEIRRAVPEVDERGCVGRSGDFAVHVQLGQSSVLIDLGCGELAADSWLIKDLGLRQTAGVQSGLAAAGIHPEQVTHVLISHAHGDHYSGATVQSGTERLPRYSRARYLISRAEWEGTAARQDPASEQSLHLGTLERLGMLDLIDGDSEVLPGITMLAAPGESPGHSVIRVQSAGETLLYVGDLFHHRCEVDHLDWMMIQAQTDQEAMLKSRQRIAAEAVRANAVVVFTHHIFPGWGRIMAADGGYRWVDLEPSE